MNPAFRSGAMEYVFDADGIRIQSHLGEGMYKWDGFKEYGTTDEYRYVRKRDDRVITVNQNELLKEELQELRQLLENNLAIKK